LKVSALGEGSQVEWSGQFEASEVSDSEAVELVEGIYRAGLDNLKKLLDH
jgi:hypothetical protein